MTNSAPDRDAGRNHRSDRDKDPVRQLCHEISGPLTSILVQCDMLLQTPPPPDSPDRIASIQEEALRISRSLRAASR
jgi:signal transduction histidine kinase